MVLVVAGTYGPATLNISRSGASGQKITVKSWVTRGASIVGPVGAGEAYGPGVRITASNIVFDGFDVTNSAGSGIRNTGNNVTIQNNYVHDNARRCGSTTKCGQGIASNNSTNVGVVIEKNISARNGSSTLDHNYYLSSSGMVIRNNVAKESIAGYGFQIYPNCDSCLVYNNVSYGNSNRSGFLIGGDFTTSSSNVKIYNNISMNNGQYGFYINSNGGQPVALANNIAFGNGRGFLYNGIRDALIWSNLYPVDPQFVDAAGGDFHIKATSPARNTGNGNLYPPDDIDFETRPMEFIADIGATEYNPN